MRLTLAQHAIAVTLVVLDVVLRGARLRELLPVPLLRAVIANTCGDALAAVTPARLGGEPVRFLAIQRAGPSAPAILAAFATEMCIDAILIVAIGAILSAVFADVGRAWLGRLVSLAAAPSVRIVTLAVLAALVAGAVVAARLRRRWPRAVVHGVRDAWGLFTARSPRALAGVTLLTLLSMAARTAILPVLAARVPGAHPASVMAGSFVLIFIQSVLPVPAGLGPVDLGFAAWFAGTMRGRDVAQLLVAWRFYTIVLGAGAGALLLVRVGPRLRSGPALETAPAPPPVSSTPEPGGDPPRLREGERP